MVHAIPVTVPPSAWQTTPVRRGDGVTTEQTHAVWRLEAQTPDGDWRVVNAGGIRQGDVEIVRGRFQPGESEYRVMWVPQGGGGSIQGQTGSVGGPDASFTLGGLRIT